MRTIIAELCQNHNGDLSLMKEMVWAAAEAGATYAKVQSMLADDLSFRERFEEGLWEGDRQVAIKRPYRTEYERLKPMDLSDEAHGIFRGRMQQSRHQAPDHDLLPLAHSIRRQPGHGGD